MGIVTAGDSRIDVIDQVNTEETEQQLIDMAADAVRKSNWTIGKAASKWTERYASGRTDADFAELIGASQQSVNFARRIFDRFYSRGSKHNFTWREWKTIVGWDDADRFLDWAEAEGATFKDMDEHRRHTRGEDSDATQESVRAPSQQAPEPHKPIVRRSEAVPELHDAMVTLGNYDAAEVVKSLPQAVIAEVRQLPAEQAADDLCGPKRETRHKHHTGNNEWYTPPEYIEPARTAMGGIDLDPASCELANQTVQAATYYTAADDGLTQSWSGRVWMNPPYSQPAVTHFCSKLVDELRSGNVSQAITLTNNATETQWFRTLAGVASAACFTHKRIHFINVDGEPQKNTTQAQVALYFGDRTAEFVNVFSALGDCWKPARENARQAE